ncbi:hypothetical protein SAMN05216582_1217 [Selenomonas ruminantium]|uniref:Uncharacterized protein n=1 Tax=Selenomonas ruminantium TaxID=971 RepID=A0A1M6VW91_SELRU|nr:hypothetical protein [Selenomonas ruminantium]SHK85757.1 hypothetical protein SAMN05216582_1217 [Selenomonas ruminantium]
MNKKWQAGGVLAAFCFVESVCAWGHASPLEQEVHEADENFATLNVAGQEAIRHRDYVLAEHKFREARASAFAAGHPEFVREMDARRAAMYINDNEPSRAVLILSPYIKPGVDKYMLSDYLLALRLTNQPKEAVKVFTEYVRDWQDFPTYGLQSMGDLYLRQRKYNKAAEVYAHILSREKMEDVPYVQLGYALALARQGKTGRAAVAYQKMANLSPRYNNAIAGDGAAFIAEGRVGLARKLFASLGITEHEREYWLLRYAQELVQAGQDYGNDAVNFKRDERLANRSYYHEAAKILRQLIHSQDEDIAHEAQAAMAVNKMHNELLADSRRGLQDMLDKDNEDMLALAARGEYERLQLHNLKAGYSSSLDDKRNREQTANIDYDSYWGRNFYLSQEYARHWLQDDDDNVAFGESATGLRKKFVWGEIAGEWIRYDGARAKNGYSLSVEYDFNDVTHLDYQVGRRLHDHAGTVREGIRENYQEVSVLHQLTPQTTLQGSYQWADLTDQNKYREYDAGLAHLLQIKHNYSDRLQLNYSHSKYKREMWSYDSPQRRVEYTAGFRREWNLPQKGVTWQWQSNLNWSQDNDERMGFSPYTRLAYKKEFPHNQSLELGGTYRKYYRRTGQNPRRRDGYALDISYNWGW